MKVNTRVRVRGDKAIKGFRSGKGLSSPEERKQGQERFRGSRQGDRELLREREIEKA